MPRTSTLPTLYDECKRLNVTKLKSWNYLVPNQIKSGTVTWSSNGMETGSISIQVESFAHIAFVNLSYKCNGESIAYRVQLTQVPSNLGKGVVWYFVCPKTGKRCRNLYLVGGYFYHRSAFRGVFYQWQVFSRNTRNLCKGYDLDFGVDRAYCEMYKKYFKRQYRGKPTKRYKQLLEQIEIGEREIERELFN